MTGRGADAAGRSFWISRLIAGDRSRPSLVDSSIERGRHCFRADMTPEEVVEQAPGHPGSSGHGRRDREHHQSGRQHLDRRDRPGRRTIVDRGRGHGTAPPQTSAAGELIRLYRAVFGRFPDELGCRYWAAQQAGGLTLDAMIDSFAVSAEYRQRYGTNPSDAVAIAQLYRNVLDREPDAAGAAYWQEQLSNGVSRNVMLNSFVDSTENILGTGTQP
ncbi:MAG: DUF4214 domain-containing protein [Acidimicrobiales bacterium]